MNAVVKSILATLLGNISFIFSPQNFVPGTAGRAALLNKSSEGGGEWF